MTNEELVHFKASVREIFQAEVVQSLATKLFIPMYFTRKDGNIDEHSLPAQHTFTEALETLYRHLKEHPFG